MREQALRGRHHDASAPSRAGWSPGPAKSKQEPKSYQQETQSQKSRCDVGFVYVCGLHADNRPGPHQTQLAASGVPETSPHTARHKPQYQYSLTIMPTDTPHGTRRRQAHQGAARRERKAGGDEFGQTELRTCIQNTITATRKVHIASTAVGRSATPSGAVTSMVAPSRAGQTHSHQHTTANM